jgi:hypothetical protein
MFVVRFGFPESPTFLYKKGKYEDCETVLRTIARRNNVQLPPFQLLRAAGDVNPTSSIQAENSYPANTEDRSPLVGNPQQNTSSNSFQLLLSPPFKTITILLWLLWFLTNFGYTGFNIFLPKLLKASLHNEGNNEEPLRVPLS